MFFVIIAALAVPIFLIYRHFSPRQDKKQHYAEEAKRRGCAPAPVMSRKGFLGFGQLLEGLKASRQERGPQHVIEAIDSEMGPDVHTVIVPISDYELIVSRDPVNIQAVLATNAAD